jgi:hypothetical protein
MTRNTIRTCTDGNIVPVSTQRRNERYSQFVAFKLTTQSAEPQPQPFTAEIPAHHSFLHLSVC